ncbi:Alpha/Beta hydrolase protein [Suillus subalutaceus]|uniref:Alpha/Beta hydrolase protein n=1 Tax=Suillus subalutaceus TaxID=48586 RepID=UPI001B8709A3|nr:Alpha/Beta hydrolase protein [Suillus subalutaceus]KAG1836407.1 Alpha/Beta hydrolase protein [Suillus subalutaceus]
MYASNSASQWGSPTAPRKALLIHGLISCSSSWEGVAQLLVAEGFFVVAPNLLGHAWRRGTDYRVSTLAEDLRPYFINDTSYDVVVGSSLGGTVALSLLPFLPKTKQVTVILLDPPLEREETVEMDKSWVLDAITNVKTAEELVDEFGWSRRDCVIAALGVSMCDRTTVEEIFSHNRPWSFSGLFKNIPPHVKVTVLAGDPEAGAICLPEHVPCNIERLNVRVLPGIGHAIQLERPEAIMDVIQLPRAKL